MKAGTLRHLLTLVPPTLTADEMNQPIATYNVANAVQRWGSVEPLEGRELEKAKALSAEVTHRVRIRYDAVADVDVQTRILHRGRTLEVVAALNRNERNIELSLMCKEAVD